MRSERNSSSQYASRLTVVRRWMLHADWRAAVRIVILALASFAFTSRAATFTWDGSAGDGLWFTNANFGAGAGGNPGTGDTVTFDTNAHTASTPYTISLGGGSDSVRNITFTSRALAQGYTITNGTITINNSAGIVNNDADTQTISATIALATGITVNASGGALLLSNVTLGANTLTVSGGANTTIGGNITGTGGITKTGGAGSLILSGNNSHTGTTNFSSGQLHLNSAGALGGNGSLTLGGGTLDNSSLGAVALSSTNAITWGGNFTFAGTQSLDMGNGAVSYSAARTITVSANTLTFGGTVTSTNRDLTKAGAGALTLNGNLSLGSGGVDVDAGTLTLAGTNTYTGGTTLASGATLNVNSTTALGSNNNTFTISGGTLDNTSAGPLTLANTYAVTLGDDFTFAGTQSLNLGTSTINFTAARAINVAGNTLTVGGTVTSSNDNLTKTGAGELVLNGVVALGSGGVQTSAGTLTLAGANTYSGGTSVATGATLNINNNTALGTGGLFILGGTIDNTSAGARTLTNNNIQAWIGDFTFGGTQDLNLGTGSVSLSGTRQVTVNGGTLTVGGVISGSGFGLTKAGAGTLVLNGLNTYDGPTTITGGVLEANTIKDGGPLNPSSIGDSSNAAANLVLNGGTLRYNGAAQSTDRLFSIGTSGGTLEASGSGALNFTNTGNLGFNGQTGARTLTLTGTDAGLLAAAIGDNSGATSLVKNGAGTWTLSGNSTFSGGVSLNAGTLNINSTTAIGTGTFTVAGGTTFDNTSGGALTLANNNASVWNGDFTFAGTNSLDLGNGTITLGGDRAITVSANTLSLGDITDGASSFSLAKNGSGTLTLNGAGTYNGGFTLNAGTLNFGHANAATALGTGTFTIAGGTIDNTSGAALTVSNANTQSWNSDFVFTGTNNLNLGTGNVTLSNTRTVTVNGGTLTVDGIISDGGNGYGITKAGSGTLSFGGSGSNTYSGITTVNAGALTLAKTAGSIAVSGSLAIGDGTGTDTVQLNAANQIASTAAVTFNNSGGTPTLNLNGFSQTLGSIASTNTSAQIQLGTPGSATALTVGNASDTTFSGVISGGANAALVKEGSGNLTLNGTNTYSGATTINAGTLTAGSNGALGAAGGNVTVAAGATLSLSGNIVISKSGSLSVSGSGTSGTIGALHAAGAGTTGEYRGNVTLAGNATFTAGGNLLIVGDGTSFANTLALGTNALTLHTPSAPAVTPVYVPFPGYTLDPSNIVINSILSGSGDLNKTGTGTATIIAGSGSGNTLFTGDTRVTGGKLIVDANLNTPGINSGQIYIGNQSNPGLPDTVTLQIGQLASSPGTDNTIGTYNAGTNASASSLTIYSDGKFAMNKASNGFVNLTLEGGHVDGGNITFNPLLTLTGAVTTVANSRTAKIENGNLAMSANDFTFTVASGASDGIDLKIDSIVQNGTGYTAGSAGTSLVKEGAGTMVLTAANTYSGVTNVAEGILNIRNGSALGQTGGSNGDTNNGTVVASGAQLQLQGGITVGPLESLTLNGAGISSGGALLNKTGDNTYNGFVFLDTASRINSDSGTLTIANTNGVNAAIINGTSAGKNLTVGGSGNVMVKGGISAFVNDVTKDGAGTLTLAGTNGYGGATAVTQGAVKVTNSNGLSGTGVTVTGGAALQFARDDGLNNISVVGVGATLNGAGLSDGGAIQNLSGNNSYFGAISLATASRINADVSSSLTLTGGITSSNAGLTVGGAGNVTESGTINLGSGSLTKDGAGTFKFAGTVNGTTGTVGAVSLQTGTIEVGNGAQTTTLNTGNFAADAGTTLSIATGGTVVATYTGSTTFSGDMDGAGTFQKSGAGTLVFDTTFTASNLTLKLSGGTVALAAGAQLTFGTIHITGNTILDFGGSANTFLSSANLVINAGVTITVNNWVHANTIWYATSTLNAGTLGPVDQVGGTPLGTGTPGQPGVVFTGYTPGLTPTWVSGTGNGWFDHEIRPTPEPSTYGALLISGSLALLAWRRWRRRNSTIAG